MTTAPKRSCGKLVIASFEPQFCTLPNVPVWYNNRYDFAIHEGVMVYRGHVERGVVVLDDAATLPEGSEVRVELATEDTAPLLDANGETLGQRLLRHAGKAVGLPPDLAVNHDHYLYGTPKE